MQKYKDWVRLSHVLSESTPAYGGGEGLCVEHVKNMRCGDSCNTVSLNISNHLGSHVDAPRHFFSDGMTVDDYGINEWVFHNVLCVRVVVEQKEIITIEKIDTALEGYDDAELLLICTGFESHRTEALYWNASPAFSPDLAGYLKKRFPSLKAIGLDTISISSVCHRDVGREAHKEFLGRNIRIFEDLSLNIIPCGINVSQVIALPLFFEQADGAPCTVIARLGD